MPLTEDDVDITYGGNPNPKRKPVPQEGIYNVISDNDDHFVINGYQDGFMKFIFKGDHKVRRLNGFSITSATDTKTHVSWTPKNARAYYNTPNRNWFNQGN